jgi:M6 family metalloprotease-like protein
MTKSRRWRRRGRALAGTAFCALIVVVAALATPAAASPVAKNGPPGSALAPIDPQHWENPDSMTWAEYQKVPHTNWSDPSLKPSVRTFKAALLVADYQDLPFTVTQQPGSTPFGNPRPGFTPITRDQVPTYYRDLLNKPQPLNHDQTLNSYWMEDSGGRFGVSLDAFGPYRMPGDQAEYGLNEWGAQVDCPVGETCNKNIRTDVNQLWTADQGADIASTYDMVIVITAGQDESSTWQEFGEQMWSDKSQVPDSFGPPNNADHKLPNWAPTRYIDWTSWAAASAPWPNTSRWPGSTISSTTQDESSGLGTFAHEFSHVLGIGDNYNNPFGVPPVRAYTGPWDMLSRGSFGGPGGTHTRWNIPSEAGGSLGVEHDLRNKMKLGIVGPGNVLHLSRDALAASGTVVVDVTSRETPAQGINADEISGLNIAMTGADKEPTCSQKTDPLCDGGGFDNYTVEAIDRVGADSFAPDHGVMLAKTKDADRSPFVWTVDANPQDIHEVDYYDPNGKPIMVTVGDQRQLNDALFHAGPNSGSQEEYVDQANRLHFYILDTYRDKWGDLHYVVGVRSLDGAGPHVRGVSLGVPKVKRIPQASAATCNVPLANTGRTEAVPPGQPDNVAPYVTDDVYRISAQATGFGWSSELPRDLVYAKAGGASITVPVNVVRGTSSSNQTTVTVTARSESNPNATASVTCTVTQKQAK